MVTSRWFKSPDILVLRQKSNVGFVLLHQVTKQEHKLDMQQAAFWTAWRNDLVGVGILGDATQSLVSANFILTRDAAASPIDALPLDHVIPVIGSNYVKWYAESPDLFVLFNTQAMPQKNPLLALGPYGSLCWRGVIDGLSIGQTRNEALRVFGYDEVIPFLKRLLSLGFIRQIAGLGQIHTHTERMRKEFNVSDIQFQLTHATAPWYCVWEVCMICDLECKTCYLPHFNGPEPDIKHTLHAAQQIIDAGIFYVSILGGEPLLRDDLEQIIERLRAAGVFVKVISNGQKLTLDRARALANADINHIEISFDGLSSYTHESSRGQGTYAHALQAIRHAQQAGIPRVGIVWTVHTDNFDELKLLPKLMRELGVQECYVSRFKKTGLHGKVAPFDSINAEAIQVLQYQLYTWKEEFPELTIVLLSECSCGRTSIVLGDNGDVRLCTFSYQRIGNIKKTPLLEIWRSITAGLPESGPLGYCANENIR